MSPEQLQSGSGTWHFRIAESQPSMALIEAMAFVKNQDPTTVEPLGNVLDPEAFDLLLSQSDSVMVSFEWGDCDVRAFTSGEIIISEEGDSP